MHFRASRAAVLIGALLSSTTTGFFCSPGPAPGPPPEPSVSCGEGAPPADGQPAIDLASPETGASLEDGVTLPLEYGDQGGSHVTAAARLYVINAETWSIQFELFGDGEDPSLGPSASGSVAAEACANGWTDVTTPVFRYSGVSSGVLRVTATAGALTLTDEVRVNLQ